MKYISSDTNVWLDFNAISRITLPFRLDCKYIMYKEALRKEIVTPPELLAELQKLGLEGVNLTTEEFYYAQELSEKYKKLSGYDRTALAIAKFRNIPLLTGDGPLRNAAKREHVQMFGTIGLLDKLYEEEYIDGAEYAYCLESLINHTERRLPKDELRKRLELI